MLDDTLFEDPARLLDVDRRELLRTAAMGGAQVRAAARTAAEVGLSGIGGERPRCVVLVAAPGIGMRACHLLAALAAQAPVPIVVADTLPNWVGALDAVFVHAADPGDTDLAETVSTACRRGATVALAAGEEGPVAASGAGRACVVPPTFPVPAELSLPHALAVGLSLFTALGLLTVDLDVLADELDGVAEQAHPDKETLVNPAKTMALRMADRTPLLWGVDPASTAVARHGAFALGCHVGMPSEVGDYAEAATQRVLHRTAAAAGSSDALFADPEDLDAARTRVFLISVRNGERAQRAETVATRDLPGADVIAPEDSAVADGVLRSAVLAARFDFTAIYLGLAAGVLDGPSWPAEPAR